jgi:hypothetical protein
MPQSLPVAGLRGSSGGVHGPALEKSAALLAFNSAAENAILFREIFERNAFA